MWDGSTRIFTIYREGKEVVCHPYILKDIPSIIPRFENVDYMPNYILLGSLVLLPFSSNLRNFNQCGSLLKADCIDYYRRWPRDWEGQSGLVVLTEIFAHELSFSYSRPWRRVISYNGIKIKSLEHLQQLWTESCTLATSSDQQDSTNNSNGSFTGDEKNDERSHMFARLELENDDDIVFEVRSAMKAQVEVMAIHAISKPYSIVPSNPKYI